MFAALLVLTACEQSRVDPPRPIRFTFDLTLMISLHLYVPEGNTIVPPPALYTVSINVFILVLSSVTPSPVAP